MTNFLVHHLFEQQVKSSPDSVAIVYNQVEISYAELNILADKVGRTLMKQGIQKNDLVGVCLDRSIEMIAALLGIMKLGAGYLPLDITYPKMRLNYMILDSGIQTIVISDKTEGIVKEYDKITPINVNHLEDQGEIAFESSFDNSLAYVIYTSGSTGNSKGVAIYHSGLMSLFSWLENDTRARHCHKTLQFSPLSFDPSFMEIFSTLTMGNTLVLIDEQKRKDPEILLHYILEHKIERLFVPIVVLGALANESLESGKYPLDLKEINCGGDTMKISSDIIDFFKKLKNAYLNNQYGPTEAAIMVTNYTLSGEPDQWEELPPLGKPITDVSIKIFDDNRNELDFGNVGEIYISGKCLAQGYWNREELTKDRFIIIEGKRYYRTGDLGVLNQDGNLFFKGRIDDQVKVNGIRIELGEVESTMMELAQVQAAVATVYEESSIKRFVAYYVGNLNFENVKAHLRKRLPETMVPHFVVQLDAMPLTSNGKIDKSALPRPQIKRVRDNPVKNSELENSIIKLWEKVLHVEGIEITDNFFDVGGNSLLAMKIISKLRKEFDFNISVAAFFQYPTVKKLAAFLLGETDRVEKRKKVITNKRKVAVVGMVGKFSGAENIDAYWDMIIEKKEGIHFFSDQELDSTISLEQRNDPNYVKARGYLEGSDLFDPAFFGLNPRVAELMDPQIRLMLEYSHHALESAGIAPHKYEGTIGAFLGMSNNTYYSQNVIHYPDNIKSVGEWTVATLNEKDYITTQVAHKLGLTGPAVSIHCACSTSLVTIAHAIRAIENGDCDVALAGGVNIDATPKSGYLYQEGNIRSRDGHCRPFDSLSSGTVFCDGIGVVVLKELESAIADGDLIYSVIRGVGINNDGDDKVSFTAPSVNGQKRVIQDALDDQGVRPEQIGLVEAHGTATPVGDPIEVEALNQAWNTVDHKAVIGSVKGNIGHTIGAAGVAGFIKINLAVKNKYLPPTLHFNSPNPKIDFSATPFEVLSDGRDWVCTSSRYAAVSSFGVGGTNAHIIIEEYEVPQKNYPPLDNYTFPISAKNEKSLNDIINKYREKIEESEEFDLGAFSETLWYGREDYLYRGNIYANTRDDLLYHLKNLNVEKHQNRDVMFAFPGQGSQFLKMGLSLYKEFPIFKNIVDQCAEILQKPLGIDIRDVLFYRNDSEALKNTYFTQPALFVIEYSLAKLLESFGVKPQAMIGHSVGEFPAAVIAGVMTLKEALLIIAKRSSLMTSLPTGAMLSVMAPPEEISKILPGSIQIAAHNGPKLCVLAGANDDIDNFSLVLKRKSITSKRLHTSHAFHSKMMEPMVEEFEKFISQFTFFPPKIPIYSTVILKWVTNEMCHPNYWAGHVVRSVMFNPAIKNILSSEKDYHFVELGPRNTLCIFTTQQLKVQKKSWSCIDLIGSCPGKAERYIFIVHLEDFGLVVLSRNKKYKNLAVNYTCLVINLKEGLYGLSRKKQ